MATTPQRQPLGQLLVSRGLIHSTQLEGALAEQRQANHQKLLGEILIERQLCSDEQVTEALAIAYEIPFARVGPRIVDSRAVALLPYEFLKRNLVVPMFRVEGMLTVALCEPANLFLLEEIERRTNLRAQAVASTARDIRATLEAYLPAENAFVVDGAFDEIESSAFALLEGPSPRRGALPPAEAPVIKLIEYCIYSAIKQKASEIHIEPAETELRIRFRVDGRLVQKLRPPLRLHVSLAARLKAMAGLDPAQKAGLLEGTLRVAVDDRPYTLRVLAAPARNGERLMLRICQEYHGALKLEKLGFSYDMLKQWRKLLAAPSGLLLVCGPADSGKHAVLYSSLAERNTEDCNLCSVEDPIEHAMPGVNQFPVDGSDFAATLAAVLRQEPDMVMLSHLRDLQTATLAAQAALSGKVVVAGMHAADAPGAVSRLLHLGVEPHLLGSTLAGVLSRRLVRKLCAGCKSPYEPSSMQKRQIEPRATGLTTLFRARGCERCNNTGFSGRIGIHELLVLDDAFRERISAGISLPDLRALCQQKGLKPLRADGLEKAQAGVTTPEEVLRVAA
jgi:type IV pilus assembly protein PilB